MIKAKTTLHISGDGKAGVHVYAQPMAAIPDEDGNLVLDLEILAKQAEVIERRAAEVRALLQEGDHDKIWSVIAGSKLSAHA